jgi:hypothetical protein
VITVFVSKQDAVELLRPDAALFKPDHDLPGAEAAINENSAIICANERAVPGTAAAEHGKAEHEEPLAKRRYHHKRNQADAAKIHIARFIKAKMRAFLAP